MPRAVGVDKAMEHSVWHKHIYKVCKGQKGGARTNINSHVQLTPFYQHSVGEGDIGRYFGIGNGKNSFVIGKKDTVTNKDIDGGLFVYNVKTRAISSGARLESINGTISFEPDQEAFGLRLDYFQDVNTPMKKLFFKASLPITYVRNDMDIKVAKDAEGNEPAEVTFGSKKYTAKDFFAGNVNVTSAENPKNLQGPLTHAKIDGARSSFGLADLELALGYKFYYEQKKHLFLSVGMTIPTGTKPNGEYLFEPVHGNGHHFGLNISLDGGLEAWKGKHGPVRADFGVNYRYLFIGSEKRTLGVKGTTLGHYYLVAELNQKDKPLFPLANVSTTDLRIKPGNQFDAIVDFSFHCKRFVVDVGYNMYWKDQESVWVKGWNDKTYYVPIVADTSGAAYFTDALFESKHSGLTITKDNLDVDAAKTPEQFTHKIFGGIAYTPKLSDKYPTSLGLGASYEFAQENSALEKYALWLKMGISF